jgi:hypothetical protein
MTQTVPTAEQEQRAKWDAILTDLEARADWVRQMKPSNGRRRFRGVIVHLMEKY